MTQTGPIIFFQVSLWILGEGCLCSPRLARPGRNRSVMWIEPEKQKQTELIDW